ncbi:hypothetical protein BY996DRAFT_6410642 [Phakopsora pachyrhizi]|nr:hypothetical protein BY996DRAFT_6410642 [Phakopsora pachyrhizi]
MIGRGSASGRESRKGGVSKNGYKKYGGGLTGAAFLQDIAGPTGQEAGFSTRNAASGAAIARRVSKNRHCKGMLKDCGKKYRRADNVKGCTVTWDRYCRANEGKNALWRNKVCSTDKEAVGREEAGGQPE